MNDPRLLTGIYSFAVHAEYGPHIKLESMNSILGLRSLDTLTILFKDIMDAHPKTSIVADIDAWNVYGIRFLQSLGAQFRFKNSTTLVEQWIIVNGLGAPIGANSRIGIMAIVYIMVQDIRYILLVKERFGCQKYKFVTGGVDGIEPLLTVYKEVSEEVGLVLETSCILCGSVFNNNCFPNWDTEPIMDICMVYSSDLGTMEQLPKLYIDESEIIDAIWHPYDIEIEMSELTKQIIMGHMEFNAQGYTMRLDFNPFS